MVLLKNLVEHHCYCVIVSLCKGICSPTVIHATALCSCGHWLKEQDA